MCRQAHALEICDPKIKITRDSLSLFSWYAWDRGQIWQSLDRIKYRWTPKYLPSMCPCGKRFDVDHAMSCMKGGFVHRRHDDVRDLFATLLKDVCHDVEVEPHLDTLTGEVLSSSANSSDEVRLDVSARVFWQKWQKAFFDVRVFNPFAKSLLKQKLDTAWRRNVWQSTCNRNRARFLQSLCVYTIWWNWQRSWEIHNRASAETRRPKEHDL